MLQKQMKIAFLSFYSGIVYRGVETYVHELAERLHQRGNAITVYQSGPLTYGGSYKTVVLKVDSGSLKNGNIAILINQIVDVFANFKFTLKVLKTLDKDTDFIVATNNRSQTVACRIWCMLHKTKLVVSGQSGPGIDERIALWSFPDVFIPLSNHQKQWAKKTNPFVKISEVIPNGTSVKKFSGKYKRIDLGLKGKIILCAAALWPVMKRQHLLIRAVSKLKDASLLLAGAGEGEKELQELGTKLLGERFMIKSFKYDDMPQLFASCDLFSFPTWPYESFGIVIAEAMASGLGVVVSDDPIRREIVGDAGLFVDPNNTEEYAKALEKALNTDWGDKPRKQALKFDWDLIAQRYEDLFKTL